MHISWKVNFGLKWRNPSCVMKIVSSCSRRKQKQLFPTCHTTVHMETFIWEEVIESLNMKIISDLPVNRKAIPLQY